MLRFPLVLVALVALVLAAPLAVLSLTEQADTPPTATLAAARTPAQNTDTAFSSGTQWRTGTVAGAVVHGGSLRVAKGVAHRRAGGRTYDEARWSSPWITPRHPFTEVVPSWNAVTPKGTWLSVRVRVRSADRTSTWQNLGRWASGESDLLRSSFGSQPDALTTVSTDTLRARAGIQLTSYRLQLRLERRSGSTLTPRVRSVHAVASRLASTITPVSRPSGVARVLPVPAYSQMVHRGEYPQYGGGGEAWCSPTALAMVLGYYDALPRPAEYAWVKRSYPDRFVAEVARRVFDHRYDGTGNWPFNTAYAAPRLADGFVTRLTSLRETERYLAAGIPLEASISFSRGELAGAPIGSTPGHLVVIVGFTRTGDVVVNDPAASTDASVRRTYDRAQFEAAWQSRSHGAVYVLRDRAHPLPR